MTSLAACTAAYPKSSPRAVLAESPCSIAQLRFAFGSSLYKGPLVGKCVANLPASELLGHLVHFNYAPHPNIWLAARRCLPGAYGEVKRPTHPLLLLSLSHRKDHLPTRSGRSQASYDLEIRVKDRPFRDNAVVVTKGLAPCGVWRSWLSTSTDFSSGVDSGFS